MDLRSWKIDCSPLQLIDRITPENGYCRTEAVSYGQPPRLELDVYAPSTMGLARPVVIFFYGGSWQAGNRETYRFVGQALASRGIVCVLPDYRVYPEACYPEFVEDGALAVGWARKHIESYGGDPERIFLMGYSAGAYIAAMLALSSKFLEAEGLTPGVVSGMIGLAGPYDFLPIIDPVLKTVFGPEERWSETQPIHWVDGNHPPMLLLTGGRDATVRPGNSQRLAQRIREHGGAVEEIHYPWLGHMTILGAVASSLRWIAPILGDVTKFVASQESAFSKE